MKGAGSGAGKKVWVYLPVEVADWLDRKAQEHFKRTGPYIRDILVTLFKRDQRKEAA